MDSLARRKRKRSSDNVSTEHLCCDSPTVNQVRLFNVLFHRKHFEKLLNKSNLSFTGSISIAWLRINGMPQVLHIQPFNSKDLGARALSDRLADLEELKTLYPNISKKEAFEKFRVYEGNNSVNTKTAYVPAVMRLVVLDDA